MTEEQKTTVTTYAKIMNSTVTEGDLLTFVVDEVSERVLLYLNRTSVPDTILRTIAGVVTGVFLRYTDQSGSLASKMAVTSVSDNGQSVSYSDKLKNYMVSSSDNELFGSFSQMLKRYRRIGVVGATNEDGTDASIVA